MGQHFDSPQEFLTAAINITQQFSIKWYRNVYRQWVLRRRCIEHSGEYFEKEQCCVCVVACDVVNVMYDFVFVRRVALP